MRARSLLAGTALALILAIRPAGAAIPVSDAKAIALQTASWARQAADMLQQIAQLREYLRLSYLATAVLGEDVGGGFAELFSSLQDLGYTAQALNSEINALPYTVQQQLDVFQPPMDGAGAMGWISKAKQIQSLLSSTSLQTMEVQSKMIKANAEYARQAPRLQKQMIEAKGQMQATQVLGLQLANISGQLSGMQTTLTETAQMAAARIADEQTSKKMQQAAQQDGIDKLDAAISSGPVRPSVSVLDWRSH